MAKDTLGYTVKSCFGTWSLCSFPHRGRAKFMCWTEQHLKATFIQRTKPSIRFNHKIFILPARNTKCTCWFINGVNCIMAHQTKFLVHLLHLWYSDPTLCLQVKKRTFTCPCDDKLRSDESVRSRDLAPCKPRSALGEYRRRWPAGTDWTVRWQTRSWALH